MQTAGPPPGATDCSRAGKLGLALECAALFLGLPAAVVAGLAPFLVIPLLLLTALGCGLVLRWRHGINLPDLIRPRVPAREWRRVLLSYAVAAPGLVALLWFIQPDAMFALLCRHTRIWVLVMIFYPLLSVFPQELVYRAYFFERYRPLFGSGPGMVAAAAAVFAFGHIVFGNWLAVALTGVGGWLFATTYRRTGSLGLVSVEHALYGWAIFTIGYGPFFFDGTLRLFR
jgi:membrane protease YdiL (CAAX protease family)